MMEIPDAKKCCLCLPLRRGLLVVGYLKLASEIGFFLFMIFFTMLMLFYRFTDSFTVTYVVFLYILIFLGIIFDVMFIISAHRKNHKCLRIYYWYLLTELSSYAILLVIFFIRMAITVDSSDDVWHLVFGVAGIILFIMTLHIYFIYLVRSETRKLEIRTLFKFKTHFDEPECTAHIIS